MIIDHHPRTADLNAKFIDIKEEYGAAATLMTEYLRAAKIRPSPRLATALFYAIKTDTDNFVRPTVDRDMIAFRFLYDYANMSTDCFHSCRDSDFAGSQSVEPHYGHLSDPGGDYRPPADLSRISGLHAIKTDWRLIG